MLFVHASTLLLPGGAPQHVLVRKESAPAPFFLPTASAFLDNITGTGGAVRRTTPEARHARQSRSDERVAVAVRAPAGPPAGGFPSHSAWQQAPPVRFSADWQGKNADSRRETEVRLLWTPQILYLRFVARFRSITVFPDAEPNGRRDHLWDRDVAEVFLQADTRDPCRYQEFEISPNGFWIDLDIAPGEKRDLRSGLSRRVSLDETAKVWTAELAIPMPSLVRRFDPAAAWRVNFFRIEGPAEARFYSAWRPTGTPQPNFHVPEAFGTLVFQDAHSRE